MRDHDKEAELVADIARLVYSLNEAGHDSFFEFAGHAELLTIKVHEGSYMTEVIYNEEIWLDYPPGKFKEKGIVGCLEYHRDHLKVLLEETGKKGPDIIAKLKNFIATNTQEKPDNKKEDEHG